MCPHCGCPVHGAAPDIGQAPSFTNKAMVALLLTCCLWVPGAIATRLFFEEARGYKRSTGMAPPGYDFLQRLYVFNAVVGVLLVAGLVVLFVLWRVSLGA